MTNPPVSLGWLENSDLVDGATITVLRDVEIGAVLEAFGATGGPALPRELAGQIEQAWAGGELRPWAVVALHEGRVVVVEPNGWVGTSGVVLRRASPGGLAVSVYWNVNLLTDIEIAEDGAVVGGIRDTQVHGAERFRDLVSVIGPPDPEAGALEAVAWGLRAQTELTGLTLTPALWQHLQTLPCAYELVPPLPEHHPNRRTWNRDVAPLTDAVVAADPGLVADLAWQYAGRAAAATGADERPEVVSTLATRSLDTVADLLARRALIAGGTELVLWRMLHAATNPDAPSALLGVLGDASFLLEAPAFADLLHRARGDLAGATPGPGAEAEPHA